MTKQQEDKRWEARGLVLACMTIAMAILLVIVEKTPLGMVFLLVAFVAYTVYPVVYLTGFSDPAKRKSRWVRVIVSLVLIVCFGWVLGVMFWPTPRIRITKLDPFPLASGSPVQINLTLRNDGRDARIEILHHIFFADLVPADDTERSGMEDKLWQDFILHPVSQSPMDILTSEETWTTVGSGEFILNKDQFDRLAVPSSSASPSKKAVIYVMGKFHYTDMISEKDLDFCAILQNKPGVVVRCSNHNGVNRD